MLDISESQTDVNENKVDDINSENKMDVTRDENYDDRTPQKTAIVLDWADFVNFWYNLISFKYVDKLKLRNYMFHFLQCWKILVGEKWLKFLEVTKFSPDQNFPRLKKIPTFFPR